MVGCSDVLGGERGVGGISAVYFKPEDLIKSILNISLKPGIIEFILAFKTSGICGF